MPTSFQVAGCFSTEPGESLELLPKHRDRGEFRERDPYCGARAEYRVREDRDRSWDRDRSSARVARGIDTTTEIK